LGGAAASWPGSALIAITRTPPERLTCQGERGSREPSNHRVGWHVCQKLHHRPSPLPSRQRQKKDTAIVRKGAALRSDMSRSAEGVIEKQFRLTNTPIKHQAIFCRRRHQPRRPPLAKIRPGRPAPAVGPGTDWIVKPRLSYTAVTLVPATILEPFAKNTPNVIASPAKFG
jgi:hypothetical protein